MVTMTLTLFALGLSGCAMAVSDSALCDGSRDLRRAHAGALLADGGNRSQATGERLLTALQAGCGG